MIAPRRHSRTRVAFFATIERLSTWLGGRRFYRWRFLAPQRFVVRRETLVVDGLPEGLDGLRIAHVADFHAGPFMGAGDLEPLAAIIEREAPDVVCATGDFVTHAVENAQTILAELSRMTGRLATVAVFGNHDYVGRREQEIAASLAPAGWRFLRNDGVRLEVEGATLGLCGIEDPEEGKVVDPDAAVGAASPADLVVAMSHGPAAGPHLQRAGARVVLSGHTHGTQMDLPILRRLGPAHPGLRVELGGTTIFVTRGVGAVGVPFRWGSPAEVCVIELSSPSCKAG